MPLQPTEVEIRLIDAAQRGETANYASLNPVENDPGRGASWGDERTIRADIIYALATGGPPGWGVHARGISVRGAKIVGSLQFGGGGLRCRLALIECYIAEPINLVDATTYTIALGGSRLSGIEGERISVSGGLFLNKEFTTIGAVNLKGATITGQLNCEGGHFQSTNVALDAEGSRINGGVFLSNGFSAKGDVRLLRIHIEGELNCAGGRFEKLTSYALAADGAVVAGGVFLSNGFLADGEVRLLGARVTGQISCDAGTFNNPKSDALGLDGLRLDGDLFLGRGFVGNGKVTLNGAVIEGSLSCEGGSFDGLYLERAIVKGTLSLRQLGHKPTGPVDLAHAQIGQLSDDEPSWPQAKMLFIDGFEYGAIAPGSPAEAGPRLTWLRLQRDFSIQSYEALARVLRSAGHKRAAMSILVALEDQRSDHDSFTRLQRLGRWFYGTLGYGYEPRRGVLCWAALIVLAGSLFVWFGTPIMTPVHPNADASGPSPFLYSLDSFLPIHAFHQAESWWPRVEELEWSPCKPSAWVVPWGWLLRSWLCAEIISGWALTALFAAASVGIVRSG